MLQECSTLAIARIFFNEPTKPHYLMEISRKSKIAHTSVKNHLDRLKKQLIIRKSLEQKGKRKFPIYQADYEQDSYKKYKRISNLINLEESGLILFLKDKFMPKAMVLFGSYFRGEDIEDSDVDIFLESKSEVLDLKPFEKKINRKIQLHFKKEFNEYPSELKNNIINGLVLSGYLEVFK